MNKDPYMYQQPNQIYTKKRNIDSVMSIRSNHSNKSSTSTKARSNISNTLSDITTITSFVFELSDMLLVKNINETITASLMASNMPVTSMSNKCITKNDNLVMSNMRTYLNSCVDINDIKVEGSLCLSSPDSLIIKEILSLCNEDSGGQLALPMKMKKGMGRGSDGNNMTIKSNEVKILRINKLALYPSSIRNNSNNVKEPKSAKKEKDEVIGYLANNRKQRFRSPPNGISNAIQANCISMNEARSLGKTSLNSNNNSNSNTEDTNEVKGHYSQITNITPVSIKIKVYNSNKSNEAPINKGSNNATMKSTNANSNVNTKRIMPLPKKAKEYIKASSPKQSIPSEMHKEMNATYVIKTTTPNTNTNINTNNHNNSLGLNKKQMYNRAESPIPNKKLQLKTHQDTMPNQSKVSSLPYSHQIERVSLPQDIIITHPIQIQTKSTANATTTSSASAKSKSNSITQMKPPLPIPPLKKPQPNTMKYSPEIRQPKNKEDKLNLSCDSIYPESNTKRYKSKLCNSELNKSFDGIKQDFVVFDLDKEIFKVINNSSVIVQDKPSSIMNSQFNSYKEQEKYSLQVIKENNELNAYGKGDDWDRASANFRKEELHDNDHDCFDRFSFHNKKMN